jgi:hypothetical protein
MEYQQTIITGSRIPTKLQGEVKYEKIISNNISGLSIFIFELLEHECQDRL